MLSTKDAIQLCTTIRASAREAATNRQDCRTLARFVGKIMLILQALEELPCSSLVGNWAEVIGDVKEALWGAAELVETCGNMGRLQAVLQAEEARARFVAVATDLALAVSGLGGVREQAPADVSEDIVSVQRQLEALKFASRAGEERLTWRLMQALTLLYMRAGGAGQAGPLLAQALEQAGLDPGTSSWLDVEVARLKDAIKGAQDEEDWIAEFFYKQVIMCLLARLTGAWDWVRQPSGQGSLWGGSTPAFSSTTASPVKAASPLLGPAAAFTPAGSVGGSGTGSGSSGKSEQEPNGCGMGAGDGERGPSPLPTPLARAGEAALRRGEGAGGSAGSGSGAFPGGPLSSAVPSPLSRDYDKENGNVLADGGAGGQNGGSVVHSRTGSPGLPTAFAQHAQQQLRQGSSTAAVQRLVSAWFGADTAASSSTPSSSGGLGASCGGEGAAQQDTLAEHALALGTAAQPQRTQRPHQGIAVASSGLLGAACSLPSQSSTAVVGAQEDSSSMLCSLDADGVTGTHQAEQQLSPLGNNDLLAAGSGSDSPLSVDTLTALFDAFGVEGCAEMPDTLKTLDPLNLNSVVAALSSPSMLTQFVATVIIEYHAEERGEEGRAALVGLKVIPALLRALQSSRHPILRGCIASAFRHLARDAATRRRIAEAGAIPLLAQLLTSGSRGTRQAAARALSNLVVNSEANKVEVVKFGAVHSLVRMLESESEFSREASAAALANLAANSEETQAAISAAGAIPSLVSTLRQSSTAAAQQHAARALRNMAGRDNQNKLRAAEAGAIPLLVELMKSSNEASCQAATSALSNIAANCEETQVQIAEAGALTVLLGVLESGSAACREACAWLLSNLACCSEVRAHIPPERVSPPLVGLLQSAGDSGRQAAARALKALSAGPSNSSKLKIADAGAIPPLVACLSAPSSDATRKAAASALWNLAYRNNSNRRAIAKAGAIPPLVLLLAEAASDGCRQEAARALSNLSCNNEYNQGIEMARHGAIPLLVRMMSSAQAAPGAKEAAAGAVSNLACIKANQAEILESGALPAILALMGAGQTPGCQEAAARAFGNLVCDNMSPQLRTAAGQAVPLLVALVQSGNEGARQAAARALSNLACSDPASQLLVARSGAAQALVLLAQYPNDDLREAAAVALWDLCYDCQAGREAVVRAGGIPWLTELLLFGGDGAKEAAAAAIAELAAVGPAVRQEIEEAGAVPLLRQLAAGDCQEVAMAATEALRSLEANRSGAAGGAAAGARGEGGGGYKRSDSGKGSEGGAGSRGPMSPGRQAAAMRRESMAPLVATMN